MTLILLGVGKRDKVTDENLLLVLVPPHQRYVFSNAGMLTEMDVDLPKLDTEPANLDLIVRTTGTLDGTIR